MFTEAHKEKQMMMIMIVGLHAWISLRYSSSLLYVGDLLMHLYSIFDKQVRKCKQPHRFKIPIKHFISFCVVRGGGRLHTHIIHKPFTISGKKHWNTRNIV